MDLGKRILQARQEAGLSQRQLCGEEITRNMLSQIEHGTARPSMTTLQYLAERLGKSVSYFLEEDPVSSPNQSVMAQARFHFAAGDYAKAGRCLEDYKGPDPIFDTERYLLHSLILLEQGEQVIREGRLPYARDLLEQAAAAGEQTMLYTRDLERRRLLLLARAAAEPKEILARLKGEDEVLLLRAADALADGLYRRAGVILDAAQAQDLPHWNLLRGRAYAESGEYAAAAACLHKAEADYPHETAPLLERCYRELEDFKQAYFYACKQR